MKSGIQASVVLQHSSYLYAGRIKSDGRLESARGPEVAEASNIERE
jgi:hypothetical protein